MTDAHRGSPRTVFPIESSLLLTETFGPAEVTDLRHTVTSFAGGSGLSGQRLEDFILAVNELLTNAVRHGGGQGWLRLWCERRAVICEVSDSGEGIPVDLLGEQPRPAPDVAGGWGLWLARQLTDEMVVHTSETGTTVRIVTSLDDTTPVVG
ncbi:ATP-binding protein [Plantactinospora sp. GCM10030261]|uniref:ATP-binding protein n=1 Tax=Plantactinospora sp. GCM10030261 TaxID=3273420 RepID=UPI0036110A5C